MVHTIVLWLLLGFLLLIAFTPWTVLTKEWDRLEWVARYHNALCSFFMLAFLFTAGWHFRRFPDAADTITGFLASQVLKTIYLLKPDETPAWLLITVLVLFWYRNEIKQAMAKLLHHGGSLEVVGIKLHLPEHAGDQGGDIQFPMTLAQAAPDLREDGRIERILPGTVGEMQPGPYYAPPWYQQIMGGLPTFFDGMTSQNQDEYEERLREMERPIAEEYEQHIAISVHYLSRYTRKHQIVLNKYFSTAIAVRRLMLYFHGRTEQAHLLVRDMPSIGPEGQEYLFTRSAPLWLVVGMCRDKEWEAATELSKQIDGFALAETVRTALSAYISMSQGEGRGAADLARAGLHSWKRSGQPWIPAVTLLQFAQTQALFESGVIDESALAAEALVTTTQSGTPGLPAALRSSAMHVLTHCRFDQKREDALVDLYEKHEHLRQEPFLLNALAIIKGRKRQRDEALGYLRRAEANLPKHGCEELRRSIHQNRHALLQT